MLARPALNAAFKNVTRRQPRTVIGPLLRASQAPLRPFSATAGWRATGGVSQQPGSKDVKEMSKNAVQEAKGVASDVAKAISGANAQTSQIGDHGSTGDAVKSDLQGMAAIVQDVPQRALFFGGAGILPYAGTALTTIYLSRQASIAQSGSEAGFDAETAMALLHHVEQVQVGYGAIILSFLGAIHWGFEFAGFGGRKGTPRYLLGIAPVLAGWGTLLLPGQIALAGQWMAFLGMWYADQKTTRMGWAPKWYSTYRFWLTALVGSSIIVTLGGANYFGPGNQKIATTKARLDEVRVDKGPTFETDEIRIEKDDDGFVKLTNKEKEREQKEKEERERKEKEQAQKDKQGKQKEQPTKQDNPNK